MLTAVCAMTLLLAAPADMVLETDFERGLAGWSEAWSRTPGIKTTIDQEQPHAGKQCVRLDHPGKEDWSFQSPKTLNVAPGEIYEMRGWVRLTGEGNVSICVTLKDGDNKVIDWTFAEDSSKATPQWRELVSRFIVPPKTKTMLPRVVGHGPATIWIDDVSLRKTGALDELRAKELPERLVEKNELLEVTFDTKEATLSVFDRRGKRQWKQRAEAPLVVLSAVSRARGIDCRLLDPANMLNLDVTFDLAAESPELVVSIAGDGKLPKALKYPHPFVSAKGSMLVMPVNEGISYPVDDESLSPMHYILYGGHGLCMPWWGVCEGQLGNAAGLMTLVETPDDAAVRVERRDGLLCAVPQWDSQKGKLGYQRKLRYVFCDDGGYVAMAKRYRKYAKETGLLKTLAEKRKENPSVDKLMGAANIWCWEKDAPGICRELREAGMEHILWSNRGTPETLKALNELGVLTSRYDIYQDVMNPAEFPKLRWVHGDWTTAAWPKDLMLDARGDWIHGWAVETKDDGWVSCGVTCDARAVDYAKERIPAELKTHPYRCRFIDTTTASPWRECYHPDHPLTRSESRKWKMRLLEYVSKDSGLVCGSETGHDAAVPYVHYFEGMLSLGPYRVPDSGRNMQKIVDDVPERVAKFQTGHGYRLPLWELVYHDCAVAQWYWGDYNNKLPKLWDRRDLWNALYGTPPMLMFNRKLWQENRDRFAQSYQASCPVARKTGYHEMLSHAWLTADRSVQQTRFADGTRVTVNFGDKPFALPDGSSLPPLGKRVEP